MDVDPAGANRSTIDDVWQREHRDLHAMAARMLRDRDEADDVVQEAFGRLLRVGYPVDDPRGWLIVVVRRLCLNRLDAAYRRRESTVGATPPEDARTAAVGSPLADPADRATLDDQVQHALAVVLDRLTPAERTAFVLHDVFGLSHDQIGQIVGRTAVSSRQLASRARKRIRSSPPTAASTVRSHASDEHRHLVQRFVAACAAGDVAGLIEALDPDASVDTVLVDGSPIGHGDGPEQVAADAVRFLGPATGTVLVPVFGDDGVDVVALYRNGGYGVLRVDTTDGSVHHLQVTVVPPDEAPPR